MVFILFCHVVNSKKILKYDENISFSFSSLLQLKFENNTTNLKIFSSKLVEKEFFLQSIYRKKILTKICHCFRKDSLGEFYTTLIFIMCFVCFQMLILIFLPIFCFFFINHLLIYNILLISTQLLNAILQCDTKLS